MYIPLLLAAALIAGSATPETAPVAQPPALSPAEAGPSFDPAHASIATAPPPASAYALPLAGDLRKSRFTIKGGYYGSSSDDLDDGGIINVSWMRFFTSLLAIELEAGYLGLGDDWGIPLFINGRLNLPVWVLDLYGGIGVGTIYYDVDVLDDSGFLLAGSGFLGATLNALDLVSLGIEAKYYVTEEIDDVKEPFDGVAVMLTLGF